MVKTEECLLVLVLAAADELLDALLLLVDEEQISPGGAVLHPVRPIQSDLSKFLKDLLQAAGAILVHIRWQATDEHLPTVGFRSRIVMAIPFGVHGPAGAAAVDAGLLLETQSLHQPVAVGSHLGEGLLRRGEDDSRLLLVALQRRSVEDGRLSSWRRRPITRGQFRLEGIALAFWGSRRAVVVAGRVGL